MSAEDTALEAELAEEQPEGEVEELDDDMKAAIESGAAASPAAEDEEEDVPENLREAVEGSFHMKRLLEEDGDGPDAKKQKVMTPVMKLAMKILTKWGSTDDLVQKYVLDECNEEELKALDASNYAPDKMHWQKSACDLLARHVNECRERKMAGGYALDCVATFKFRWKLTQLQEKTIRALSHKDLRFVFNNYDGSKTLDEVIKEAKEFEPEEESTETALPEGNGVSTIGRFGRLELIDPLADSAVFGDANLTFSVKLARHRRALGHVGRVIATTFEELPTLRERYPEIDKTICFLEEHFAEVHHGVDCTRIAVDEKFKGLEGMLGAAYYNFPHSGAVGGFFDGHPVVNWRHENLMRLFFRALRSYMKPGGVVKVASNAGAVGVRYSYIVNSAQTNEFVHVETIPFLEWHLHRYGRSYGDRRDAYKRPDAENNQSYNAQAADRDMVYCFCYAPSGEPLKNEKIIVNPPSFNIINSCVDGPFKTLYGSAKTNLANQLRKRFVTEASGVHVG